MESSWSLSLQFPTPASISAEMMHSSTQALPGVGLDLDLPQAGQGIFFRHCPINIVHHVNVCPVQRGREELQDKELRKTARQPLLMARCLLLPALLSSQKTKLPSYECP